jgi:hypothetical protein
MFFVGTALCLGSLCALIPAGLASALLLLRTQWEDQTLQAELPGYKSWTRSSNPRNSKSRSLSKKPGSRGRLRSWVCAKRSRRNVHYCFSSTQAGPLHGSTHGTARCFNVNTNTHTLHCFKCGRSGNALDLWATANRLSIYDAAIDLSQRLNIPLPLLTSPVTGNREEETVATGSGTCTIPRAFRRRSFLLANSNLAIFQFRLNQYITVATGSGTCTIP